MSESTAVTVPGTDLSPHMQTVYQRTMEEAQNVLAHDPEAFRRFTHLMLTQLRTSEALQRCSEESLARVLIEIAVHNLDPSSLNECFIIPYKGEATLQLGYAGLMKLALSHPDVLDVFCEEVCANDTYQFLGIDQRPRHEYPGNFQPRGPYVGYYAAARLSGGRWRSVQRSVDEVKAHAKHFSIAYQQGKKVWKEEPGGGFRGMALKTMLRMICHPRNIPMKGAVAQLIVALDTQEAEVRILDQETRLAPQIALEGSKSLETHISDLYGDRTSTHEALPAPQTSGLMQRIDALLAEQGLTPAQQAEAWDKWHRRYPDLTPAALTIIYESLQERAEALYARAVDEAMVQAEAEGQDERQPCDEAGEEG